VKQRCHVPGMATLQKKILFMASLNVGSILLACSTARTHVRTSEWISN
jgi:hypothetical protein